jgi:exodeoxyribonuclease V alpha subunit
MSADSASATVPTPADAFAAFAAAGLWPGMTGRIANRLPSAGIHGPDDVSADRLAAVPGVSARRAERLAKSFAEVVPVYAVARLLHNAELPLRSAATAVETWGDTAARRVVDDPWALLDLGGLTPRQADLFALRTASPRPDKGDLRRGRAFTVYVLTRGARDGHTLLPETVVRSALTGLDLPDPAAAVSAAVAAEDVLPGRTAEEGWLALTRFADAERRIAAGLARLLNRAEPLCTPEGAASVTGGLDPAQRAAVAAAAEHGVSLLTGGPGTGKSRTVAAVVELCRALDRRVELAAPTGRAAKRLEELAGAPAGTLHRRLAAQGTSGQFARGPDWPLDADVVVVDEASMLDVELAAALVDACPDGAHLLLVGDPAQLPSIGPGRVLADLIDGGQLAVTELTTLHRQAEGGAIARLATAVRAGELPPVESAAREVVIVRAAQGAEAAHRVVQLVTDSIPRALGIPTADVQVVTPVHRGPAGTEALNAALKARLNPGDGGPGRFDVGDRVVATANHLDDGFANGEVGVVTSVQDGALEVSFGGSPVVVPPRAADDLRHGWAVTVHRAQGSEWPAVVAVLPGEAAGMLSRPLVYTAFTRARRHLSVVHAAGPALARAVRLVGARPRRTQLTDLLRTALSPAAVGPE